MGWRIVQQPNGLYARFSEVVDDFTDYDMTPAEAEECCLEYVGRREAKATVQRGIDAGPARFTQAINTIRTVHGEHLANERQHALSQAIGG